jgi:hypothetical protein
MPPRHYRIKLRSNTTIIQPTTYITYSKQTIPSQCEEDTFQIQLFDIIEIITQRLEILEITNSVNHLVKTISAPEELHKLLDTVETTSISIVQNITDGVDIGIIKCRIEYIRTLISSIPDGSQNDYAQVGEFILGVLAMISDGIDTVIINDKLTSIKLAVDVYANCFSVISEIQYIICGIVQNITDGVDIGIIRCRIQYLNDLIAKLPEGAQEEYAAVGEIILGVLGMITEGVEFSIIIQKLSSIQLSVKIYDIVDEIKLLVCSIVQNIMDGVDIGIIKCRIEYLRTLITTIPPDISCPQRT